MDTCTEWQILNTTEMHRRGITNVVNTSVAPIWLLADIPITDMDIISKADNYNRSDMI